MKGLIAPLIFSFALNAAATAAEEIVKGHRLTPKGEYTFGIEGPAVDRDGHLFVVNFQHQGSIGRVEATTDKSKLFINLPAGSVGNAIRFDREGRMFIADYKKHTIFVVERGQTAPQVYFHDERMNQPNDITVAIDGTLYASDPSWKHKNGQLWIIRRGKDGRGVGTVLDAHREQGTTNGIDLSPDGKILYVSESETQDIYAYTVKTSGLLEKPRRLIRFPDPSIDGLRTDISGRIYIARILKGVIAVVNNQGLLEREIALEGKDPTNLAFGGADGRTVYVSQRQGGYIESFRAASAGREWCLQHIEKPECHGL